ncbi:hypothetical protein N0V84_005982 [Fusarium piperis]|uniref:Uncharacterized protein n=1 Tax=Fusarium piperis TaxID=1435070 RepID=A0A9W8WCP1_9HYPO|nr:hypothetical protein N0V84_005982 [Fusarium piperis]
MAFNYQFDLVDRQYYYLTEPLPLTEQPSPEARELELIIRQIEIIFPAYMEGTLLAMSNQVSFMDVCLDGQRKIYGILRAAEAMDCFLQPLQGTGQTRLVDRLIMHQQALTAAAIKLHQDLANFMQSLEHMGQPDGLEERAWKMRRATD